MNKFRHSSLIEDMGMTQVENAFINHYMPSARGDYVKVYLYGLKCCYSGETSPSDEQIAEALKVKPEDVKAAWDYWENAGVVSIDNSGKNTMIEYMPISELLFSGRTPAKKSSSRRSSRKYTEMFSEIEDKLGRTLSANERDTMLSWAQEYSLTPQTIVLMIEDCLDRGKKGINYWDTIARVYFDMDITTYDQLKAYIDKRDDQNREYREILNYLGIYSLPSQPQKKLMDKWLKEYGFDMDAIKKACDETIKITSPNLAYVDKILSARYEGTTPDITPSQKRSGRTRLEDRHNYDYAAVEKALFGDDNDDGKDGR